MLTVVLLVICVPPEDAVYQPTKCFPVGDFVGVGSVPYVLPYVTVIDRINDINTGDEIELARLAYISDPVARIYNFYFQTLDSVLRSSKK